MYLEKLEIQGFKSFANKTVLTFPARGQSSKEVGMAAIVGPNGSGKSNIADAVRWVLGEQSLKLLRGKKSQDVIFSGSEKLARLGFAEVSLYLNNEDKKAPIEYEQVIIKRRVYRDGSSEYKINNAAARLTDIQLLLAQANFGHRTYSVIGQGMIESFLLASETERKEFFDEATGVKQYQIKKDQTIKKLEITEENLTQVSGLLREITPRLKALERQIEKLKKRGELEKFLSSLQLEHYSALWNKTETELEKYNNQKEKLDKDQEILENKIEELNLKLKDLEKEQKQTSSSDFEKTQAKYQEKLNKKAELTGQVSIFEHQLKALSQTKEAAREDIDYGKLINSVKKCIAFLDDIKNIDNLDKLKPATLEAENIKKEIEKSLATDEGKNQKKISDLKNKSTSIAEDIVKLEKEIKVLQKQQSLLRQSETRATSDLFNIQKEYQGLQNNLNKVITEKNQIEVKIASLKTHKEDLSEEINRETKNNLAEKIKKGHDQQASKENLWPQIAKIKQELEMIGGIEPETDEEYSETKKRHDFLNNQANDLKDALGKTKQAVKNLEELIEKKFNQSFVKIEKGFSGNFSSLFNGGKASLLLKKENELDLLSEELASQLTEVEKEKLEHTFRVGIEIKATPPGKKVSNINMLSGGERALTSIALITAIIQANPSPFVVLDEVDAALDEANSERFAEILAKMNKHTQFIAITHNRATMEKSNVLYGITMGQDSVSRLLSVDLEKAMKNISTNSGH